MDAPFKNNGRLASDHGYQAHTNSNVNPPVMSEAELSAAQARIMMNAGRCESTGMVAQREQSDNMRLLEMRRRILEITEEDESVGDVGRVQPDQRQSIFEDYSRIDQSGGWIRTEGTARLKRGKSIPVWTISNPTTGMKVEKPFRLREAADRYTAILNQGGINDGRLQLIVQAHDAHVQVMKEIRQCRAALKEGRQDMRPRLQRLQARLERLNGKLGI